MYIKFVSLCEHCAHNQKFDLFNYWNTKEQIIRILCLKNSIFGLQKSLKSLSFSISKDLKILETRLLNSTPTYKNSVKRVLLRKVDRVAESVHIPGVLHYHKLFRVRARAPRATPALKWLRELAKIRIITIHGIGVVAPSGIESLRLP